MGRKSKITGLSFLVLSQVVLFVVVYLASIAIGAALVYVAFHASIFLVPIFFDAIVPAMLSIRYLGLFILAGIVITFVGLWAFIVAVGVFLVKPLFSFPKRERDYGVEIHREDSPKLYDMIMSTAKAVGVRAPKHIYVNNDVNATVFFNTGFWNIFFPVRKNLIIGLGLFNSTNVEEVRSVIAHEFGHFAQGSMRVGSVLYVADKVICDLAYRRDRLDNWMVRWCLKNGIWGFWGKATQGVVIRFRRLMDRIFKSQQRNYLKLSQQMEYDADAVACRIVGKETFASALCKSQQISRAIGYYNYVLNVFYRKKQVVADFWKGYDLTVPHLIAMGFPISSYDRKESEPDSDEVSSRVVIDEVWESHPSTQKRIEHAPAIAESSSDEPVPAWELVSDALKSKIWKIRLSKEEDPEVKEIDWESFEKELETEVGRSLLPNDIAPFFARDILNVEEIEGEEDPVSEANRKVIKEYEQALTDLATLEAFYEGKIAAKHVLYDGRECGGIYDNHLLEHRQYLKGLQAQAETIDGRIRALALSKADDREDIESAYRAIYYSQAITARMKKNFLPVREDIIRELNASNIAGDDDFHVLKKWLDSYETALKDVLKSVEFIRVIPFMTREEHIHMSKYIKASQSFLFGINSNDVNHMFAVTDWIMRVHSNLNFAAKQVVVKTILGKEIQNISFLSYWRNKEKAPEATEASIEQKADDNHEHITIDGDLHLTVPTDEEIDTVGYPETFRYRLWEVFDALEDKNDFKFELVATMPIKNEDGLISNANPDDFTKFMIEVEAFKQFMAEIIDNLPYEDERGEAYVNGKRAWIFFGQQRYGLAYGASMKGAIGGNSKALAMLGLIFTGGYGKPKDPVLAVKLFKCAAAQGDMVALRLLANTLSEGEGIEKDETRALKLFERAARQGDIYAEYNVGTMYLKGIGVEPDPEKGLFWLYKAANHGYEPAINLTWQYHKSVGDMEQYVNIIRSGAQKGIKECIDELKSNGGQR